jgi:hypothetical protein
VKNESAVPDADPVSFELLHAGLAALPEKYRVPLLLHHLEGRTQEETAALLNCSLAAVTARLHRGRQLLRDRLSRQGVAASVSTLAVSFAAHTAPAAPAAPASFVTLAGNTAAAVAAHNLSSVASISGPTLALSKGAMNMLLLHKAKRIAAIAAALLLITGVGTWITASRAAAATTSQPGETIATGRIASIKDATVTITSRGGKAFTFTVDDATTITLDGTAAKLADLKTDIAAAAWIPQDKPARELRAYSKKPATTP